MANLDLRYDVRGNQTCQVIRKKVDPNKIDFHNDHPTDELTITFVHSKGTPIPLIKVKHGQKGSLPFAGQVGDEIKYTATIGNAKPEDPIIIFER